MDEQEAVDALRELRNIRSQITRPNIIQVAWGVGAAVVLYFAAILFVLRMFGLI